MPPSITPRVLPHGTTRFPLYSSHSATRWVLLSVPLSHGQFWCIYFLLHSTLAISRESSWQAQVPHPESHLKLFHRIYWAMQICLHLDPVYSQVCFFVHFASERFFFPYFCHTSHLWIASRTFTEGQYIILVPVSFQTTWTSRSHLIPAFHFVTVPLIATSTIAGNRFRCIFFMLRCHLISRKSLLILGGTFPTLHAMLHHLSPPSVQVFS